MAVCSGRVPELQVKCVTESKTPKLHNKSLSMQHLLVVIGNPKADLSDVEKHTLIPHSRLRAVQVGASPKHVGTSGTGLGKPQGTEASCLS